MSEYRLLFEPHCQKMYLRTCASSEDLDQHGGTCEKARFLALRLISVKTKTLGKIGLKTRKWK